MENKYYEYKETFTQLPRMLKGVLYEPVEKTDKYHIGLICLHSHGDYSHFIAGPEFAKRGYRIFCSSTKGESETMENKCITVGRCIDFMRNQPGVEKVLIVTHSGGATLMSAYQSIAENGVQIFQGPRIIKPFEDIGPQPAADGIVFLDANWGNAILTLFGTNPAVAEEGWGTKLIDGFDPLAPENGYDPNDPLGANYSEEFIRKYLKAQSARNDRVIDLALERLDAINNGRGRFDDDEPFVVTGGTATSPKFYGFTLRKLFRSHEERDLLRADGSISHQIVPQMFKPSNRPLTPNKLSSATVTTVKTFLSNYAVRATEDYYYTVDRLYGIDHETTSCATYSNVRHVHAPALVMGMSGGLGVVCNEHIFEHFGSQDKTLMYVEGATHMFTPNKEFEAFPGQFGDTVKLVFDYADNWIFASGRFAN